MKNTQNQKISQIKFETLVVGIDIGKETHYARAFDYRGMELARLLSSLHQTRDRKTGEIFWVIRRLQLLFWIA
ncbi:transposase [Syntrophomonas wolfei subsp. wolfei str. Goettingen G311]|uniref:Transposase n=1 Tax=Syntrophomonas wolfei subsp. wolfei (strain DSM 2245B / Goettingen) TaxID=335541 RepID=Q0AUR2_SYNWW|nr:transposase [Syntrophomonas wolfei]ABI69542.1 transposase [Syntrophomonas wolfei subsp. wolfei str. Goettingen G311]